ncbi:glycosyltransferase family 2 protein [Luteibaculum oceani]|uniref:glycosyltransferase family 2 protein n=1 Tax=Luteibaculum oceani TaxID=1294296 RepID=UPI001476E3DF|nr:glycosyltransferase family 2 protein [Luteibaculum oceani]
MNKDQNDIGIILPFKNEELYLQDCLTSISEQRFPHFKVFMVDDHSTDGSFKIAQQHCVNDERFTLLKNNGKGVISALHLASKQVKCKFISRMDGDDLMPKNKLESLLQAIEKLPENYIISGRVKYFSSDPISDGYQKYENWLNQVCLHDEFEKFIFRECTLPACSWIMHTNFFRNHSHFESLQLPEDYHLLLNWWRAGAAFKGLDTITHYWRDHNRRTSKTSTAYDIDSFFRLKIKVLQETGALQNANVIVWGKGPKAKLLEHNLKEQQIVYTPINNPNKAVDQLQSQLTKKTKILSVIGSNNNLKKSIDFFEAMGLKNNYDFFLL